jgi:hypothetical protein
MNRNTQSKAPPPAHEMPTEIPPDPLALAERELARQPLQQCFRLVTEGRDRGIDALSIICELLNGLTEDEQQAAFAYLSSRYCGELK